MEARELVGDWIEADQAAEYLDLSKGTSFKVVGYSTYTNQVIVDAYNQGWEILDPGDIVVEKCETYWYVLPEEITKVL